MGRCLFVILFALSLFLWVGSAMSMAKLKIAGPDFVKAVDNRSNYWLQSSRLLFYQTLFVMFNAPSTLQDMPISLHYWKGVQPYVAFRKNRVRACVVGYSSEADFNYERSTGILSQPWYLMGCVSLLSMQVIMMAVKKEYGFVLLLSMSLTATSCLRRFLAIRKAYHWRQEYMRHMTKQSVSSDKVQQRAATRKLK